MEDISRELEREIARAKPKPYKKDRKTRVLIVDDFGQMKSGGYLKTLVKLLSIISGVCFLAAGLFYYLYTDVSRDANSKKNRLVLAEKKVGELTAEKEVLMARLVISGKEPGIEKETGTEEKKSSVLKNQEIKAIQTKPEDGDKINKPLLVEQGKNILQPEIKTIGELPESPELPPETEPSIETEISRVIKKNIDIERFAVKKDRATGDLLVRFDIRNISTEPRGVSGRIFTILKPENNSEDQWLVVPTAALKDGVPSEYKKGQYFSIAHFKPVKFRIKNQAEPDFFKRASIFIFNEQADLVFEKLIDITEAD